MNEMNLSGKAEKKAAVKSNNELFDRSMEEFNRLFPDHDSALAELKRRIGDKACTCRYCGERLPDIPGKRDIACEDCRRPNWVTADSPFKSMKTLARAWLAAVWLRERGVVLTSPRFAAALHCSGSAAQNILKKHGYAILKTMEQGPDEILHVASGEFLDIYCKRSQDTPRRQHPCSEQQEAAQEHKAEENQPNGQESDVSVMQQSEQSAQQENPSLIAGAANSLISTLAKEELNVLNLLNEQTPEPLEKILVASSLDLSRLQYAITILEIEGVVKQVEGNRYIKISAARPKRAATKFGDSSLREIIDDFIGHTKTFLHGISRKTVQLYFAIYWYYRHRKQLPESWLSNTLLGYGAISDRKLLEFVSPLAIEYWKLELPVSG